MRFTIKDLEEYLLSSGESATIHDFKSFLLAKEEVEQEKDVNVIISESIDLLKAIDEVLEDE